MTLILVEMEGRQLKIVAVGYYNREEMGLNSIYNRDSWELMFKEQSQGSVTKRRLRG